MSSTVSGTGNSSISTRRSASGFRRCAPARARRCCRRRRPVLAHGLASSRSRTYEGLGNGRPRAAKYLQVSQEIPAPLERLTDGEYRNSHAGFQDFYATPIHRVTGPSASYATRTANSLQPHAFRQGSADRVEDGTAAITERGLASYVPRRCWARCASPRTAR
jgi:hypothetical protein